MLMRCDYANYSRNTVTTIKRGFSTDEVYFLKSIRGRRPTPNLQFALGHLLGRGVRKQNMTGSEGSAVYLVSYG